MPGIGLLILLLSLPALATIITFKRVSDLFERRIRAGSCPECGYDRAGLPGPDAPCPECGVIPPSCPPPSSDPSELVRRLFGIPLALNGVAVLPGILGLPLSHPDSPRFLAVLISVAFVTAIGSGLIAWSLQGWVRQRLILRIRLPVWGSHACCLFIASTALARMSGMDEYFQFVGSLMLMLPIGAVVSFVSLPIALERARRRRQRGLLPPL